MHTHTKKTIPAPGLAEMIATLELSDVGHPGPGWFSAPELVSQTGAVFSTIKPKLDAGARKGIYETCKRKIGRTTVTFYRLKEKGPAGVQQGRTMKAPCGVLPTPLFPRAKKKRAGK